jgi:hypothetical protein
MKLNTHTCPQVYIIIPAENMAEANQLASLLDPDSGGVYTFRSANLSVDGNPPATHAKTSTLMTPTTLGSIAGSGMEVTIPDPENEGQTLTQTLRAVDYPWLHLYVRGQTVMPENKWYTDPETGELVKPKFISWADVLDVEGLEIVENTDEE